MRRDTYCLNKPSVKRPTARKQWTSVNLRNSILTEYCKTKDKITLYKCYNLVSEYASHRVYFRNPEKFDYVLELHKWDCISTYMVKNKEDNPLHRTQPCCGEGIYITLWAISNPERWCCESAALNMPANLEDSAVATTLEKVSFHSNPKERQCQRMLKLPHNCTHLTH